MGDDTQSAKSEYGEPPRDSLDILNDDCLRMIISEVWTIWGTEGLISLCLTSRRYYTLTVRIWYSAITINFLDTRENHKLRRLMNATPRFRNKIITMYVEPHPNWNPADDSSNTTALVSLLKKLPNLTLIIWRGKMSIPPECLDVLASYPELEFVIEALRNDSYIKWPQVQGGRWDFLTHPVASLLTMFEWVPDDTEQFYEGFKKDLVTMLKSNSVLLVLAIMPQCHCNIEYPEMALEFSTHQFPKLRVLKLDTNIKMFSIQELVLWGKDNTWEDMDELFIPSKFVPVFLENTPSLCSLYILTSLDQYMNEWLSTSYAKPTLEKLHTLTACDKLVFFNTDIYKTLNLDLLRLMPNLDTCRIKSHRANPERGTIHGESDIYRLRQLCPKISEFYLTINIQDGWPFRIFREVSLFQDVWLIELHINRLTTPKEYEKLFNYKSCRSAYKYMVLSRKASGLKPCGSFRVVFVPVENYLIRGQEPFDFPEYCFTLENEENVQCDITKNHWSVTTGQESSRIPTPPQAYNSLDDDELRAEMNRKKHRQKLNKYKSIFNSRKTYEAEEQELQKMQKEIEWRERKKVLSAKFGEYTTLFDVWYNQDTTKEEH
ncbi:unnamed protein product [Periconia digitata]|uniref:Uncharacterized protein n=1 Tax=Periconia digitata TaxID=1303443 RepID=A0A9W4XL13_9PLEO|nr:unnamed protein product [Periconia digitata]